MSPSTIMEEWKKEEEKSKELFEKYRNIASEKGVRLAGRRVIGKIVLEYWILLHIQSL